MLPPSGLRREAENPVDLVPELHEEHHPAQAALLGGGRELGPRGLEAVHGIVPDPVGRDPLSGEEAPPGHRRRVVLGEGEEEDRVLLGAHGLDRRPLVDGPPSLGEAEMEGEVRVVEVGSLEEAVAGIRAVHDPVEPAEVLRLPHDPVGGGAGVGRDPLPDPLLPVLGVGVRGEPSGHVPAARGFAHPAQHGEHLGHLLGVVVETGHVAEAELVGLALVVPAELEEEQLEARASQVHEGGHLGSEDRPHAEAHLGELGPAHLVHRVPGRHVADLVAEDGRELRLGVEVGQDPPGHVDEAAGKGERVHHRVVHHGERPRKAGPLRDLGHPLAQLRDVRLEGRVGIDAEGAQDLGVGLPTHLDLPALADQGELPLARGRVHRAGEASSPDQRGQEESDEEGAGTTAEGHGDPPSGWLRPDSDAFYHPLLEKVRTGARAPRLS